MAATAMLQRPQRSRGDLLPAGAGSFVLAIAALSLALRSMAYLLAPQPGAITASHDWIFHAFWLPLHLLLARYAAVVFARNVDACLEFGGRQRRVALECAAAACSSRKAWLVSLLLVGPFMALDAAAGADYIRDHSASQGAAAALIPVIWMIEWLATAQIWFNVLGSIRFNRQVLAESAFVDRFHPILLAGDGRAPLLCGVQNALIVSAYGLSTVAYVWYADGQLSDYLVLAISTGLVLVCFFSALVQMKRGLRSSLDLEFQLLCSDLEASADAPAPDAPPEPGRPRVPYADLKEAHALVYERRGAADARGEERLRRVRLALALACPASGKGLDPATYRRSLLLLECETRFAQFGVGEIRALSLRAFTPVLLIVGKSAVGMIGH